jgi:hypothetical protein
VGKIGEMKPMDDEQAQKEMWNEKLLEDFHLRVILQRPLDAEFVKTVMCIHDDAPVKKQVVSLIDSIQKQLVAEKKARQLPQVEVKPNAGR